MTRPRVLVTDAKRASALAVIRSLGRAGFDVIAADPSAHPVGAASRYATVAERYPSPYDGPAVETARAIAELAERHRVDLVVPVTDDVIVPLLEFPQTMPEGTAVATASDDALRTAASKIATYEMAVRLGVPAPRSEVVTDPTAVRGIIDRLGSPVVVKPDRSRILAADGSLRRGEITYATTDAAIAEAAEAAGQPVLVQQYHQGTGHGIGLVLDQGRPLLAVQHRRVHEVPVTGGASAVRETVALDDELVRHALTLLGALSWNGAAMVEFKVGPQGASLMEINGRLWGSVPLAVRAGADVPAVAAAVHLGQAPGPGVGVNLGAYDQHVRARNLDLELVWIASVLVHGGRNAATEGTSRRDALTAMGNLFRPGQGDDLMAADDRRPALAGVRTAASHLARKVMSHA